MQNCWSGLRHRAVGERSGDGKGERRKRTGPDVGNHNFIDRVPGTVNHVLTECAVQLIPDPCIVTSNLLQTGKNCQLELTKPQMLYIILHE